MLSWYFFAPRSQDGVEPLSMRLEEWEIQASWSYLNWQVAETEIKKDAFAGDAW